MATKKIDVHTRAAAAGHEREAAGTGHLPCNTQRTWRRERRGLQRAEARQGHTHALHTRPDRPGQEDGEDLQEPVLARLRGLRQ